MALANKCDACGRFYKYYDDIKIDDYVTNGIGFLNLTRVGDCRYVSKKVDLCPECMKKVMAYINSLGGNENDK